MSAVEAGLCPRLAEALRDVEVSPGALRAVAAGRTVEAESPKDLRQALGNTLYDVLHAGRAEPEGAGPRSLRDPVLEERLVAAVPHERTASSGTYLGRAEDTGAVVVLDGVRVRVPDDRLGPLPAAGEPVAVQLPAARAGLSPGFFLVDGSRGTRARGGATLRVYVHLSGPDAAPAAWAAVLGGLEDLGVPYRAKVLSARRLYPRRDAVVVYLGPSTWWAAERLSEQLADVDGLAEDVSAFGTPLAPGLATAWEPDDPRPGQGGLSFGQHRSLAVAEGLVAHATSPEGPDRETAVAHALREANVDPARPARNLDSPDPADAGGSAPTDRQDAPA